MTAEKNHRGTRPCRQGHSWNCSYDNLKKHLTEKTTRHCALLWKMATRMEWCPHA